jgi:TonB family protein
MRSSVLILCFLGLAAASDDDAIRVGPGVEPPQVIHKVKAGFSSEASANRIQGTVVLQMVIDQQGRPTNVNVISPVGFGLDERAQSAIEKWKYKPATKDGKPVKVWWTIEYTFRSNRNPFDAKFEKQRTSFNRALAELRLGALGKIDQSVATIEDLAKQQFSAAQYAVGSWRIAGEHGVKNVPEGIVLIQRAADKNYAPALYEIGRRYIRGEDLLLNVEKGSGLLRKAAILGSAQAQFYLGSCYEIGDGVPFEPERARRYFRLCAAEGTPLCQLRLANSILTVPNRKERDYVQAVAWLQLAAEKLPEAREILDRESATLTAAQLEWAGSLKKNLLRK